MHALLGYHAKKEGIEYMHETELHSDLVELVKKSFIEEVGVGLRMEYASVNDRLFSEQGFREYAEDAVERMTNPFLRDPVERVTRDPVRKLGWDDRLIGAMKLSLKAESARKFWLRELRLRYTLPVKKKDGVLLSSDLIRSGVMNSLLIPEK